MFRIISVKGFDQTTRSCSFEGSVFKPCKSHESAEHCLVCESNLCNSGKTTTFKISVLLFSKIVHILMRHY